MCVYCTHVCIYVQVHSHMWVHAFSTLNFETRSLIEPCLFSWPANHKHLPVPDLHYRHYRHSLPFFASKCVLVSGYLSSSYCSHLIDENLQADGLHPKACSPFTFNQALMHIFLTFKILDFLLWGTGHFLHFPVSWLHDVNRHKDSESQGQLWGHRELSGLHGGAEWRDWNMSRWVNPQGMDASTA